MAKAAAEPATVAPPEPEDQIVTMSAVGDIMLGRTVGPRIGVVDLLANVRDELRADITVGNLECALAEGGTRNTKKMYTFRGPPRGAAFLAEAGFDVLSLANNHAMDYGADAFEETLALLDRAGIAHAGGGKDERAAHAPAFFTARGQRFAFLSYVNVPGEGKGGFDTRSWEAHGSSPGIAWAEAPRIAEDVARAKESADHVVVLLHAGYEETLTVSVLQQTLAHAAIDAGAMLVLGHHPHVLQKVERYRRGFIAYSLGNFLFDGKDVLGAVLHLQVRREGVVSHAFSPFFTRGGSPVRAGEVWRQYLQGVSFTAR